MHMRHKLAQHVRVLLARIRCAETFRLDNIRPRSSSHCPMALTKQAMIKL